MPLAAIVLAGGRGSRLRDETNKVYLPVGGRDMLEYPLEVFALAPEVDRIVVVARPEDVDHLADLLAGLSLPKPVFVVEGGRTRHQSEQRGLESLADPIAAGEVDLVCIHDGARPFATLDLVESVVAAARRHGGAIPALLVEGPLYERDGDRARPLDTARLRRVQTPQAFGASTLLHAYRVAAAEGFEGVDTAETVERFTDVEVGLVPGDVRNIKVTFVEDLLEAEDLARLWQQGRWTD